MPRSADILLTLKSWVRYAEDLEAKATRYRRADPERFERYMDDASTARRHARDILAAIQPYGPMQ